MLLHSLRQDTLISLTINATRNVKTLVKTRTGCLHPQAQAAFVTGDTSRSQTAHALIVQRLTLTALLAQVKRLAQPVTLITTCW
jgi:hypothetical protein